LETDQTDSIAVCSGGPRNFQLGEGAKARTHGERAERESILGLGAKPQRSPGAEPLVGDYGGLPS